MLFVELALIRWVGSNNVFVNNATNFVLLASFLGIGIGFLNARSERDFVRWTPLALLAPGQLWSPYNKLTIKNERVAGQPAIAVSANNVPYQNAVSLNAMRRGNPSYFYPYQHVTRASLGNVLIIGAGTGNDVAVALSEGARHIDAVEIDPLLLLRVGQAHAGHPYRSDRVTRHVDDGRAFLEGTHQKYNLILLALPDSMTALAGQSAIRLESYLLTEQSLAAAKSHLAPGGTFAMYNYYQPFLLSRYATTLEDVYH